MEADKHYKTHSLKDAYNDNWKSWIFFHVDLNKLN